MDKTNLDKSILYTTDNTLKPELDNPCKKWLVKNSCGCPIITVSQKPMDFGENVCVGDIGRSGISIDIQLLEGLKHIKTRWTMVAEHDCIYPEEHIRWIPPDETYFYYNHNSWLAQFKNPKYPQWDGMYSYVRSRRVQSQLVCSTKRYLEAMTLKINITTDPRWMELYPAGRIAEPGTCDYRKTMQLSRNGKVRDLRGIIMDYMKYEAKDFNTTIPMIDIRHETNYTGPRRGNHRTFELEPWGSLKSVLNVN